MAADPDCLFCKIAAGDVPATRVYEDERTIAFMDINPATRGHLLVIPREHAAGAVRAVKAILARHPVSFPIELRFVRGDDALLSPAHGRDSAYLAVHLFEGMA